MLSIFIDILKFIGLAISIMIVGPILGSLAGAIFELVFSDTAYKMTYEVLQLDIRAWELGAMLGFVGSIISLFLPSLTVK